MPKKTDLPVCISLTSLLTHLDAKAYLANIETDYCYRPQQLFSSFTMEQLFQDVKLVDFLKEIIDENWSDDFIDTTQVDIPNYTIHKSYVEKKRSHLKTLQLAQYDNATDEHERLLFITIAAKFYFEKEKAQISIPSQKLASLELAIKSFQVLLKLPPDRANFKRKIDSQIQGRAAVNYFVEDVRVTCPVFGSGSLIETSTKLSLVGRVSNELRKYSTFDHASVNRIYQDYSPSQFYPYKVKELCHKLKIEHQIDVENYLNLFGGWGFMLGGALATPSIKRYIDTDPNTKLLEPKNNMVKALDPEKKKQVILYQSPMEDLALEKYMPDQKRNQLAFFSPPYFQMEKYEDQSLEQAHIRYKSYDAWFNHILIKSIEISYRTLDVPGMLAIHIGPISNGMKLYDTPSELKNYMSQAMMLRWFTYCGELDYCSQKRGNRGVSSIYLFKKESESTDVIPFPLREPRSLQNASLDDLVKVIRDTPDLLTVAAYYQESTIMVIKAISQWSPILSYNMLKEPLTILPENHHVSLRNLDQKAILDQENQLSMRDVHAILKDEKTLYVAQTRMGTSAFSLYKKQPGLIRQLIQITPDEAERAYGEYYSMAMVDLKRALSVTPEILSPVSELENGGFDTISSVDASVQVNSNSHVHDFGAPAFLGPVNIGSSSSSASLQHYFFSTTITPDIIRPADDMRPLLTENTTRYETSSFLGHKKNWLKRKAEEMSELAVASVNTLG